MVRGSTITLEEYPLEEAVHIFRSAGFDSLEMWKHHLKRCKTPELRQRFAAWAKGCGIGMGGFNAVGEDYFQPFGTDAEMEATVEGLKADTEIARALGARDLLIWEGRAPKGSAESDWVERLLPRLTEVLKCAIGYARPVGIRILTEPHPFTVGMSDRVLKRLCDAFDSDWFGVTFDFCHYGVGRPTDYISAVRALGDRIRHIHFSDTDQKTSELHFPPGSGRLNLYGILDAFKEIGYNGTICLDLYGYPMPVRELEGCAARMREASEYLGINR
jgi:sugar phosphate isomerase/epimerase